MSNSRKDLAKEIETKVIGHLESVNKAHLLVEHVAYSRLCVAYNRTGNVHAFLAEGTSERRNEHIDFDIARHWIADPVGLIYPPVSLSEFVEFEPGDRATEKALAKMLAANQVTVPPAPQGNDDVDWQNFFHDLLDLLKKSPVTKAMIRAELQAQAAAVDYELLIEEQESQTPLEDLDM